MTLPHDGLVDASLLCGYAHSSFLWTLLDPDTSFSVLPHPINRDSHCALCIPPSQHQHPPPFLPPHTTIIYPGIVILMHASATYL